MQTAAKIASKTFSSGQCCPVCRLWCPVFTLDTDMASFYAGPRNASQRAARKRALRKLRPQSCEQSSWRQRKRTWTSCSRSTAQQLSKRARLHSGVQFVPRRSPPRFKKSSMALRVVRSRGRMRTRSMWPLSRRPLPQSQRELPLRRLLPLRPLPPRLQSPIPRSRPQRLPSLREILLRVHRLRLHRES